MDTREKAARLAAVKRLVKNPDFAIFHEYLAAKAQVYADLCMMRIVTPQDQAEHNFNLGMVAAFEHVLGLAAVIEQEESEKKVEHPLAH